MDILMLRLHRFDALFELLTGIQRTRSARMCVTSSVVKQCACPCATSGQNKCVQPVQLISSRSGISDK